MKFIILLTFVYLIVFLVCMFVSLVSSVFSPTKHTTEKQQVQETTTTHTKVNERFITVTETGDLTGTTQVLYIKNNTHGKRKKTNLLAEGKTKGI